MKARRYLFIGLALGLSLLPLRLPATTVEAPDLDSLINQSDCVVRAVVKSATAAWHATADGRRYISTRVELQVSETIKGTPPAPLVIELLGGRIGEDELLVTGMPNLHVGDEQVLFLRGAERRLFPLVAMMHGLYPILRDPRTGQDFVMRSNGRLLYSAEDVSLSMEQASPAFRRNPAARPLTTRAFIQQLRERTTALQSPAREK